MKFEDYYDFRKRLVAALTTDLIGPTSDYEVIPDAPITRYISGILYPRSAAVVDPSEDLDLSDDYDEASLPDPPVSMANRRSV